MTNLLLKSELDKAKTYYEFLEVRIYTENRMPKYFNFVPTNKDDMMHMLSCSLGREYGKILKIEKIGKHYRVKDKWL